MPAESMLSAPESVSGQSSQEDSGAPSFSGQPQQQAVFEELKSGEPQPENPDRPLEYLEYRPTETPGATEQSLPQAEQVAEKQEVVEKKTTEKAPAEAVDTWVNPADVSMKFNREVFDFGRITDGQKARTTFTFTNTGKEPLEIETVSACFCMRLDYSRDLIMPGGKANLEVEFDSNDQVGPVKKDIDIIFRNTDKDGYPLIKRVTVKGKVIAKK